MKRNAIAAAVIAMSALFAVGHAEAGSVSTAQGIAAQGEIGGQLQTFNGSGNVSVGSNSSGSAVSAGEVLGYGGFNQVAGGNTIGTAAGTVGFDLNGAQVGTVTTQNSSSFGHGDVYGNVPITGSNGSIVTGNQSFGKVDNTAAAGANFSTTAIGAELAVQAAGAVQAVDAVAFAH
jgi:hypothetical protein